jgi:hypothetical protein
LGGRSNSYTTVIIDDRGGTAKSAEDSSSNYSLDLHVDGYIRGKEYIERELEVQVSCVGSQVTNLPGLEGEMFLEVTTLM